MIRGWTTKHRNITPLSIRDSDRNSSVVGTILSLTSTGAWTVEIELDSNDNDTDADHDNDNDHDDNSKSRNPTRKVLVKLNAERHKELEPWMTIRKARKLLSPGVSLLVQCCPTDEEPSGSNTHARIIHAQKIRIIAVVPVTTYLARILSFSKDHLDRLFEHRGNVAHAFRPCTPARLEELWQLCHQKDSDDIFKNPRLLELCREIRIDQGWSRGPQKAPSTPLAVWSALRRMEQRWLSNEAVDGSIEDGPRTPQGDDPSQPVIYGGINVDPSLNVPDPTDLKRISYIDQRKRPQVKWMVRTICRLVGVNVDVDVDVDVDHNKTNVKPNTESDAPSSAKRIHLIDIGGGRGDLAMAVAACLAQFAAITSHVTVLDVNESSLRAAADRAGSAGLTNMSFLHQDICDRAGLLSKLGCSTKNSNSHGPCNLVFGLHCCGGLAEAAVDVALFLRADFCVSTCCFRSHQRLAVLSRTADTLADTKTNTNTSDDHGTDRDRVASLAVLLNGPGQHRGIRVLNAMRLAAAKYKWSTLHDGRVLETCQETFPMEYSIQNRIMIGVIT